MIVANAVAVLPTCTERLDGNTAATSGPVAVGVAMRAILLKPVELLLSVNHTAPSGPAVMPFWLIVGAKFVGKRVTLPEVVMRPIGWRPLIEAFVAAVNQSAPSAPVTIRSGPTEPV